MKKIKLYIFLLLTILCCGLISACANKPKQLATPQNLRIENNILSWDAVENASEYLVYYQYYYQSQEYLTDECSYDLSSLTEENTYTIQVLAVGDGKKFTDSKLATIEYTVEWNPPAPQTPLEPTKNLAYTLLEDGSGYEVSKGTADLTGVVVIPARHNGMPVKKIAHLGFATLKGAFTYEPNTKTTEIRLPDTLEEIEGLAFPYFESLVEIEIPESVKSIGSSAFWANKALQKVIFHDGLIEIEFSAFENCTALSEFILPDSLQSVGDGAFEGTAWLENQPEGLIINNNVLLDYKGELPADLSLSSVRLIASYALCGSNITSITLPQGIIISDYGISQCPFLTKAVLPSDLTVIPSFAFRYCWELKEINLPEGLTQIGEYAFGECTALTSIQLPSTLTNIERCAFRQSGLTSVVIPDNVSLENYVFSKCLSLKEAVVGKTETLGYGVFSDCESLQSVTLPEGLLSFEYAFSGCTSLKEIALPSTLTTIGGVAFRNSGIEQVTLPEGLRRIEYDAFKGSALKHIDLPTTLEGIGNNAFRDCSALTEIFLPASITELGTYVFKDCTSLKTAVVQSAVSIPSGTFEDCSSLESLELAEGVKGIDAPLSGCTALQYVVLSDTVKIAHYLKIFYHCSALKEIVIPILSVARIESILYGTSVEKIYFKGTAEDWQTNVPEDAALPDSATVYYYVANAEGVPTDGGNYWHYVNGKAVSW